MSLNQFVLYLDAVEQIEAAERRDFVTDVATTLGQLFNSDPVVKRHLDLLTKLVDGG